MTDVIDPIGSGEAAERLNSLASRPRTVDSSRRQAPSFEALLAKAAAKESRLRPASAEQGSGMKFVAPSRPRPVGALGTATVPTAEPTPALATSGLGTSAGGSAAGQAVIDAASDHLGVPYLWGGTDPVKGFDCSGLIQHAYRDVGVEMPKWSRHQAKMGVEVPSLDEALPGDVIAFGDPVDHVGLYTGDGQMLHAPKTGDVVKIGPIQRPIATIRRIVAPGGFPVGGVGAGSGGLAAADVLTPASIPATSRTAQAAHTIQTTLPGSGSAESDYQPLFESAGERWNVDPALLAAVAQTESAFNPEAVSSAGARGLMQFMPATAAEMGVDPWDPASAIDGAARYLRASLDQFESPELAIASYNAGRGAVSRYGGIPPFQETQNYVEKVMQAWRSRR